MPGAVPSLPVALRESVRIVAGRAPLWRFHVQRLADGGTPRATLTAASTALAHACEQPVAEPFTLDVFVMRDGSVQTRVRSGASSLDVAGGPVLVPVRVARPPQLPPNAAKPATRRYWDNPHRIACHRGGHQAAIHLPDGMLVDGSTATLWLVRDGRVLTPPAPPAIAGVARRALLALAPRAGITVQVRALSLEDLASSQEVFLSNAVGGVRSVRGRGGPIADQLQRALAGLDEQEQFPDEWC